MEFLERLRLLLRGSRNSNRNIYIHTGNKNIERFADLLC